MATPEQVKAVFKLVVAVGETIRDLSAASPLGGVPSGELYAHLMGTVSLKDYEAIIATLKRAGVVTETGHLLTWAGPAAN